MRRLVVIASLGAAVSTRSVPDEGLPAELHLVQEMVNAESRSRGMADPVPAPATDAPTASPTPEAPLTCEELAEFKVGTHDWGDVLTAVCTYWPKDFLGSFPGKSVEGIKNTMNVVLEENGVWAQLLAKFDKANGDYCLRAEETRVVLNRDSSLIQKTEKNCSTLFDAEAKAEHPDFTSDPDEFPEQQKLLTGYWANVADEGGDDCVYTRRDNNRTAQDGRVSISSRPSGCEMVHAGTCYGDCPAGYRPTFLTGWFRPTCTSVCAATHHPVTCGVGCASSRLACLSVILSQVKEVVIAASQVAAFFVGGPWGSALVATVKQVIKIGEFAFNVLSVVLEVAQRAFEMFTREEAEMATLVAVYEMVKSSIESNSGLIDTFHKIISTTVPTFLGLIDAQFGWADINLQWIAHSVMDSGADILRRIFTVAGAFASGKCEIASGEVAFVVEDVGDERIIGPWTHQGNNGGKKRYRSLIDRDKVMMEWDSRGKSWSIWYKDTSFGRGWWFGWAGMGWRELYETSSSTSNFPKHGWRRREGRLPLPYVVSATDGGRA